MLSFRVLSFLLLIFSGLTQKGTSSAKLLIDDKKQAEYYFNKSGLVTEIKEYLPDGSLENRISLKYRNSKFEKVSLEKKNEILEKWLTEYYSSIDLYDKDLKRKGIKIANPFINSNEVSDLYNLISNIKKFKRIKKGNLLSFQARNLNLNINFYPSTIERFIPRNFIINYFEYNLNENGFLVKEVIRFSDGELKIDYTYEKNKVKKIVYYLVYKSGNILRSTKRII